MRASNYIQYRVAAFGCLLVGLWLLHGCTTDDLLQQPSVENEAITFISLDNRPVAAVTRAEFTGEDFGAYCLWYKEGTTATPTAYITDEKVTAQDAVSPYWTTSATYFWPQSGYTFFSAYAPYGEKYRPAEMPALADDGTLNGASYKYTAYENDGTDLLYADIDNTLFQNSTQAGTPVPARFNHALAKLTVNIRAYTLGIDDTSWEITLKGLEFNNIRKKGDALFKYTVSADGVAAWVKNGIDAVWTTTDDVSVLSSDKIPDDGLELSAVNSSALMDGIVVMPQMLYDNGAEISDDCTDQYLKISYDVVSTTKTPSITDDGSVELDVNGDTVWSTSRIENKDIEIVKKLKTTEVPAWTAGAHVTYELVLSPADLIQFNPTITAWNSSDENAADNGTFAQSYHLCALSGNEQAGSVSINGDFTSDALCFHKATLLATPAPLYDFEKWVDDKGNEYTDNPYIYTGGVDATFTARFRATFYTVYLSVADTNTGSATINGEAVTSKTLDEDEAALLQATPATGYLFNKWVNETTGAILGYEESCTYEGNRDIRVVAYFLQNQWGTDTFLANVSSQSGDINAMQTYSQYVSLFTADGDTLYNTSTAPGALYMQVPGMITVKRGESFSFAWSLPDNANASLYVTAYIDTDADGAFNTTANASGGELLAVAGTYKAQNDAVRSGSFDVQIPSDAAVGKTMLRFRLDSSWNGNLENVADWQSGNPIPGDLGTNRMVYDITVNITE